MEDQPWTRRETAKFLGVPESSLAKWATKGEGPPYRLIGVHARYLPSEVQEWLRTRPVRGLRAEAPAA